MTVSSNVSLLGQNLAQTNRLIKLRVQMDNLQRQATTQKKYESFTGFGAEAMGLQRLRDSQDKLKGYIENIDKVSKRLELMNNAMAEIRKIGSNLREALAVQVSGGQPDMQTINSIARQGLLFVEDLMNQTLDGHYLFAGSNVTSPVFVNDSVLTSNFQAQISQWLAGTVTNNQLIANTNGFTASNLGLSPALSTAGAITARIDDALDVDYTVLGNAPAFQDIIRTLSFAANLQFPGALDVPTTGDFNTILTHISTLLGTATNGIDDLNKQLTSKFELLRTVREAHETEFNLTVTEVDKIENVDITTTIATLQSLQVQLQSSFEVTGIVSQLSLVNFIDI